MELDFKIKNKNYKIKISEQGNKEVKIKVGEKNSSLQKKRKSKEKFSFLKPPFPRGIFLKKKLKLPLQA